MLELCSFTSFQSELNVQLFCEIVEKVSSVDISILFQEFLLHYKQSYEILEIEEEQQNKQNDRRKAITTFLINIAKKSVLFTKEQCWEIVIELLTSVETDIEKKEKIGRVELLTENLYLFFTLGKTIFSEMDNWFDVYDRICIISEYGSKEKPGLSGRALCRWKDVMEFL